MSYTVDEREGETYFPHVIVTIDPSLVALIATGLGEAAGRLDAAVRAAQALPLPGDITSALAEIAQVSQQARSAAADLARRAHFVERSRSTSPAPWRLTTPISLEAGEGSQRTLEVDFAEAKEAGFDPVGWRRWFASRSTDQAEHLADRFPAIVGGLDGAPAAARFRANRRLVSLDLVRHSASLHRLTALRSDPRLPLQTRAAIGRVESGVRRKIEQLRRWLDRQLLLYVPGGDGRMIEIFGDIERAQTVVVVIPGVGTDVENADRLSENASHLAAEVADLADQEVAVVAWLGYDSPDGLIPEGIDMEAACAAVPAIAALVDGSIRPRSRLVLVGHSYGSVAVGAAVGSEAVEAVSVLLGSPGTGAAHATELGPAGSVWAARASGDPIWAAPENIHGADPADPEFGAARFATGDAFGHGLDQYLGAGTESLRNVALIAAGREDEVTMWSPSPLDRLLVGLTAPLLPLLAPLSLGTLLAGLMPRPTCRRRRQEY